MTSLRLPIKAHAQFSDENFSTRAKHNIEYLTETPYYLEYEDNEDSSAEPIIINDRDYYYEDDYIFQEQKNVSERTPRTPRSFDNPKRIGRRILSADHSHHLTMSERDMEHMMMMMLHNAVTQVKKLAF